MRPQGFMAQQFIQDLKSDPIKKSVEDIDFIRLLIDPCVTGTIIISSALDAGSNSLTLSSWSQLSPLFYLLVLLHSLFHGIHLFKLRILELLRYFWVAVLYLTCGWMMESKIYCGLDVLSMAGRQARVCDNNRNATRRQGMVILVRLFPIW